VVVLLLEHVSTLYPFKYYRERFCHSVYSQGEKTSHTSGDSGLNKLTNLGVCARNHNSTPTPVVSSATVTHYIPLSLAPAPPFSYASAFPTPALRKFDLAYEGQCNQRAIDWPGGAGTEFPLDTGDELCARWCLGTTRILKRLMELETPVCGRIYTQVYLAQLDWISIPNATTPLSGYAIWCEL
jgi:hypothetical protein